MHYDWLDGPTNGLSGREAVRASRSRSLEDEKASPTNGTCGLTSADSSPSGCLQFAMENRLRLLLNGSAACEVIWKTWVTPWRRYQSKPRARVRGNIGIDFGLWPANRASPNENRNTRSAPTHGKAHGLTVAGLVQDVVALWPAMTSLSFDESHQPGNGRTHNQITGIALGLWPTSMSKDHKSGAVNQATLDKNSRPANEIVLDVWSSLRSTDGAKGGPSMSFSAGGSPLPSQVSAASSSLNAPTENLGRSLHPEFAGWEMGYGLQWMLCAPTGLGKHKRKS